MSNYARNEIHLYAALKNTMPLCEEDDKPFPTFPVSILFSTNAFAHSKHWRLLLILQTFHLLQSLIQMSAFLASVCLVIVNWTWQKVPGIDKFLPQLHLCHPPSLEYPFQYYAGKKNQNNKNFSVKKTPTYALKKSRTATLQNNEENFRKLWHF